MARDTEVDTLIINELKKEQYTSAEISDTELYYVTDEKIAIEDIDNLQEELDAKQAKLVAGPNITINPDTNEISATGGGEPIDAYTKAETNGLLTKKQDVLTPNDPLKIETYRKSNMVGMVYNDDGTGVYEPNHRQTSSYMSSSGNIESGRLKLLYNHDPSTGANMFTYNTSATFTNPVEVKPSDWLGGYIEIPYTLGDIVETPLGGSDGTSGLVPVYGKLLADGSFIPITDYRSYGSNRYINTGDKIYEGKSTDTAHYIVSDTGAYKQIASSGTTTTLSASSFLPETSMMLRLTVENNVFKYERLSGNTGITSKVDTVSVTTDIASRLKEINAIRIIAGNGFGMGASSAIKVERLKAYHSDKPIADYTSLEEIEARSYYDVTGETVNNYLDLKTDSSLTVTPEGNLSVNTDAMSFGSELDYDGTNLSLLSSDGGTLSAVEINLDDKQDVLTPNDPLKIETYVKSNMVGMKYTTDGTGVYRDVNNPGVCTNMHSNLSNTSTLFTVSTTASATGYSLEDVYNSTGYIDIPYTFGQTLNVGPVLYVSYRIPNCTLGKFVDGKYVPILSFRHSQDSYDYIYFRINPSDTGFITQVSSASTTYINTPVPQIELSYGVGSCTGTLGALIQLTKTSTGQVSIRMIYGTKRHTLPYSEIPSEYQSRLQEITTCRIAPTSRQGDTTPLAVAQIGLYNTTTDITGNETSYEEWGPNQFDLSAVTAYNYLDLKVDNTTIKVNSEGNLEAQYPAELNGVKLFPITQAAYDELTEKDPNTLYIIKQETV